MVNQALRMKIAYWSEKEKENTRDRSVPDGSDNNIMNREIYFYFSDHSEYYHYHEIYFNSSDHSDQDDHHHLLALLDRRLCDQLQAMVVFVFPCVRVAHTTGGRLVSSFSTMMQMKEL